LATKINQDEREKGDSTSQSREASISLLRGISAMNFLNDMEEITMKVQCNECGAIFRGTVFTWCPVCGSRGLKFVVRSPNEIIWKCDICGAKERDDEQPICENCGVPMSPCYSC